MFKHLKDFGHRRTAKEALGFYIVYLLATALFAAIIGALAGVFIQENAFEAGVQFGTVIGIIVSITLSFLILSKKGLTNSYLLLLLALFGGLLQLVGGGIVSLIVPAYLTTVKKKS